MGDAIPHPDCTIKWLPRLEAAQVDAEHTRKSRFPSLPAFERRRLLLFEQIVRSWPCGTSRLLEQRVKDAVHEKLGIRYQCKPRSARQYQRFIAGDDFALYERRMQPRRLSQVQQSLFSLLERYRSHLSLTTPLVSPAEGHQRTTAAASSGPPPRHAPWLPLRRTSADSLERADVN